VLILKYFGSVNLADPSNTYDMHPEALRTGDFLIERWQKTGIGHTLVAKHVARRDDGKLVVELISGTMPPRQALWEDQIASKRYFGEPEFGGPGTNYDGDDYARLGGGLKRWRMAKVRSGAWINGVMTSDGDLVIPFDDYDAISARPAAYADLIADVSPEELRDGLLDIINGARTYLQDKPASCSARTKREEAFRDLYAVNVRQLLHEPGRGRSAVPHPRRLRAGRAGLHPGEDLLLGHHHPQHLRRGDGGGPRRAGRQQRQRHLPGTDGVPLAVRWLRLLEEGRRQPG
jgi:hypothetical protein